jgi:hypothetical protein
MSIRSLLPLLALLAGANAPAPDWRLAPGETPAHFAARVLGQPEGELNAVDAPWNGRRTIFADYQRTEREKDYNVTYRELFALVQQPDGAWRRIAVTTGEEEGGEAEVAAIGFANADRDADRELIVILKWPQQHYDYSGAFYEVRLFDTPVPGKPALTYLDGVSKRFGGVGCECSSREGGDKHYRFKTIAAVKQELKRLGY